jgi:hypothetical protein
MGFDGFIRKSLHKFEIYGSVVRQNLTAADSSKETGEIMAERRRLVGKRSRDRRRQVT